MDAKTYPLQEILKPERRYIVPTFQRDYEWTLDGQWRLLFEDLESAADRLLSVRRDTAGSRQQSRREQTVQPHFLGAVVCAGLPFASGQVALRSIIDGQQRLTTVQLLVRGLLDVLQETDSERSKSIRRMLFNPSDVIESPEEIYKLWPRRRDREVWPVAMDDDVPIDVGTSSHLYLQARQFFSSAARAYARDENGGLAADRLVVLADALSSLFMLVVIDLGENDDAQVIFEVLNGRQTPLSPIDLVKNLLFLRSELDDEDVDSLYEKHWAQFDDPWWKETVGRGHAQRGRRDVLLSVWLTAAMGEEASVGHLYREARSYLEDGPSTEVVLEELDTFARAYQAVYAVLPIEDERLANAYTRITTLELTTVVPVLVWLRTVEPARLSLEDHVRAVRAVESWAMRRVYVGWQTRGYGAHLARVLHTAKEAYASGSDIVQAIVTSLQEGSLGWPSDGDMTSAFEMSRFYNAISQARIRLLLGAVDAHLRASDPNEPVAVVHYDDLQIEHVLPQSWTQHWPLDTQDHQPTSANAEQSEAAATRTAAVDRIGNLTLVTPTFNRGVSNLGWSTKRPEFQKQKSLVINYDIAASSTWDEAHIVDRSRALCQVAITIWPSPAVLLSK